MHIHVFICFALVNFSTLEIYFRFLKTSGTAKIRKGKMILYLTSFDNEILLNITFSTPSMEVLKTLGLNPAGTQCWISVESTLGLG
jgi:hypothetical protein